MFSNQSNNRNNNNQTKTRVHIGKIPAILQCGAQRTVYCSTSTKPRSWLKQRHEPLSTVHQQSSGVAGYRFLGITSLRAYLGHHTSPPWFKKHRTGSKSLGNLGRLTNWYDSNIAPGLVYPWTLPSFIGLWFPACSWQICQLYWTAWISACLIFTVSLLRWESVH